MMYVRFVIPERDRRSDQQQGLFTALYDLERAGLLTPYEIEWFRSIETWFNNELKRPDRLTWSSRPHAPQRAITWLKTSAREHVARMRELVVLLQHKDVQVDKLLTDTPGYIVYEDEHQVAAIPFEKETF